MAKRDFFIFRKRDLVCDLCFRFGSFLFTMLLFVCVIGGTVTAQSLNVQGTTCTGVSVVLYIQPSYPCTSVTVYSSGSWTLPGASSVSYNSNYTQVHATWNTAGTYTVHVNYNCSSGGSGSLSANIVVSQTFTPSVSLSMGGVTSVCQGSSIHCTATGSNGGSSPGYLFYVDGTLVQNQTTNTYNTATTLAPGSHSVSVELYSYSACASPQQAYSSTLNFTVIAPPSVAIQVSNTSYCVGSTISLTANGTNITGSPTYTWKVNGVQLASRVSTASFVASASSYAANSITLAVSGIGGSCGSTASASYATTITGISVSPPPTPNISSNICGTKNLSYNGSPTGGTLWYWQGTSSLGQDYTSATATASTYSTSTIGANTYYIAARGLSGCWSTPTGVSVSVDIPTSPSNNSIFRCEPDVMNLTMTSTPAYPNYRWYDGSNHLLYTGLTYNPVNLNNGTYSYRVTSLSVNGCESAGSATVSLQVGGPSCDNYMNWNENIVYTYTDASDLTGQVAADNKVYSDGFGNAVQSQILSLTNSQVLATEKVYDKLGNQTLTTLPAPINTSSFAYRYRFTTNPSGNKYSWTDFDVPQTNNLAGQVLNPVPVGINGPGTLGWYYSSNNSDPNIAVTSFPYSRSYTPAGPDPITSKAAGPDVYRMGNHHEVETDKLLITSSDMVYLTNYYNLRGSYNPNPYYNNVTLLNIPIASNAINQFSWINTSNAPPSSVGNLVFATCGTNGNAGFYPINNVISVTPGMVCNFLVNGYTVGGGQVLLHVTDASGNTIQWGTTALPSSYTSAGVNMKFTVPSGITGIKLGIQWQTPVTNATAYISSVNLTGATPLVAPGTSSPGYKMISTDQDGKKTATFVDGDGNSIASALITSTTGTFPNQTYAFDYWSYSFYNDLGQLVASIAPKGINTNGTAASGFVSTYTYDQLGRTISTTSPDGGTSLFLYSTDGKIRFSQNQEQRNPANPRFSYTNYDYLGRLIESGEYTYTVAGDFLFDAAYVSVESPNTVLNIVDNVGYTGVTLSGNTTTANRFNDVSYIDYDVATSDFVPDGIHTVQNNLLGMISHTKNSNATTWYSYDEFGHVEWTKQAIAGLGIKTIDYTYDFLGNVIQVAYQKGQAGTAGAESFFHHYSYDRDSRLVNAATSLDGTTKTQRAGYSYYLHGPLKRVELGTHLQGIDYVYNINGALKSINNVDLASDPGADGTNGFLADVFGMSLNYYDNDYTGAGGKSSQVSVPSITNNYGGIIKSQSWHSPVDNGIVRTYGYSYDGLNQLKNAQWGTVVGSTNAYTATFPTSTYNESVTGYDKNGNIATLTRNGTAGALANYTFGNGTTNNALRGVTNSVPSSSQCISCAQLQTQLSAYLSANSGADLTNIPPITSYINSALGKTFSDNQYQAAFKSCNLTSSYLSDYFNGYVTFGQQPQYHMGTSDFSIEAWVNLSYGYYAMPVLANQKILDCSPNESGFLLQILNGSVQFVYADGTFYGRGSYTINTLSTGTWHHLVAARTGRNIAIYFDGVLQPLVDFSYQLYAGDIDANGTTDMKIGKTVPDCGSQAGFIGGIRQVRLYRRLLAPSEVSTNYSNGYFADPSNQNSLVLWAPLDDGAGTTVRDKSTYGQSGTFAGANLAWVVEPSPSVNVKPIAQILCPAGTEPSTQTSQNSIGQLTQETMGTSTLNIAYNAYGLAKEVRDGASNLLESFTYDDRGSQLARTYYTNGVATQNVYYVTDISGNLISSYEQQLPSGPISQSDVPIYGAGRIGVYKANSGKTLYELDDHLGNVRAVILPSEYTETKTATFESSLAATEQSNYLRYQNAQLVNASLFDHTHYFTPSLPSGTITPVGSSYSQRLNGSPNEMYGLAKSINVMPGDQLNAEVYAKYVDPVSSNWNAGLINLMSQIIALTQGVVIDGTAFNTSTLSFPFAGAGAFSDNATGPKAYLAWLIYDKNFNLLSYGADQMTAAAKEEGTNVPHERLFSPLFTIIQPGYVYFYLVNESATPIDVYFDDFSVTHHHSILAAGGDYYPFGLPIADRQLDAEGYRFGYQGQFAEKDSIMGTNNFQLRMYEPKFGRWLSPDPYGQFASPYLGMGNNPVNGVDANGGLFGLSDVLSGALIGAAAGTAVGLAVDPKHWYDYAAGGALLGGIGGGIYDANTYDLTGIGRTGIGGGSSTGTGGAGSLTPQSLPSFTGPPIPRPVIQGLAAAAPRILFSYLTYQGNSQRPNTGTLTWTDRYSDGTRINSGTYSANSGSTNLRPAPQSEDWRLSGFTRNVGATNQNAMTRNGVTFYVRITPDPRFGRSSLLIHPDGINPPSGPGTAGCIGMPGSCDELSDFSNRIQNYLSIHGNMTLRVRGTYDPSVTNGIITPSR